MKQITVKICGLQSADDVENCLNLGVSILGFVAEYPLAVPWNLPRSEALPLIRMVKSPHRSCIVTGGTPVKVIELATTLRPSLVQLHYRETLEDTIIIADALQKLHIGVIKTIPPVKEELIYQFATTDLRKIVKKLCQTNVYGLLADSRNLTNASGNGSLLNLGFCSQIIKLSSKPVIIAGGIHADNVCDIINETGAQFIDVMTGVESSPGVKDLDLLLRLLSSVAKIATP